jgi:hypothetical protein
MTDNLVGRLRAAATGYYTEKTIADAADRIEELEAALHRIEENADQFSMQWAAEIARAALEGKTE